MTVIAANLYRNGQRAGSFTLDSPAPVCAGDKSEFVWIGVVEPSNEELRVLQERFGLHPLAVEDALVAHQLPKVEVYGDQLFVIARTAHLEEDHIAYGETSIFVGPTHVISVRHGSARAHTALRAQLEAAPNLLRQGVDYVLHAILDFIVDGYLPIVESIEEDVLRMEQTTIESGLGREEINRLFRLRRELIRFGRMMVPMSEVASKLVNLELPCIDHEAKPYFRDVLDHVRRVEAMTASLREVVTSVFEVSTLLEQQRQSAITRQLAAWAAILAVPTAIAGIYGMNFKNMPELNTQYGYYVVLAVILCVCTALFWRFRRTGWL
jgi:magnesium transporter